MSKFVIYISALALFICLLLSTADAAYVEAILATKDDFIHIMIDPETITGKNWWNSKLSTSDISTYTFRASRATYNDTGVIISIMNGETHARLHMVVHNPKSVASFIIFNQFKSFILWVYN